MATPIIQKFIDTDCTVVGCYRCHCCRIVLFIANAAASRTFTFIFHFFPGRRRRRCASVLTPIAKQNVPVYQLNGVVSPRYKNTDISVDKTENYAKPIAETN